MVVNATKNSDILKYVKTLIYMLYELFLLLNALTEESPLENTKYYVDTRFHTFQRNK